MQVKDDYLRDEIETEPSESPANIDEPAQFHLADEGGPMMRRDTFVGTPLYVSPEMLQESISLPASDIWALGCIIFRMLTGRNAFNGITEHQLFQNILKCELSQKNSKTPLESEIGEDALDLINKLLVLDPHKRLGAGQKGSNNDIQALRRHRYFDPIYRTKEGGVQMAMDAPRELFPASFTREEEKHEEAKPVLTNEPILVGDMRKVNWLYMS